MSRADILESIDTQLIAELITTLATPTATLLTYSTSLNSRVIKLEAHVVSIDTADDVFHYYMIGTFKRNGSGAVSQLGTTDVIHDEKDDPTWDATFTVSGTDILLVVTGDATNDTYWKATLTFLEYGVGGV